MSVHYNSGSSVVNNKAAIAMATNTSSRSDVVEVEQINPEKRDNNALASKDVGTILRGAGGSVTDLVSANGNVALELGSVLPVGTSVRVAGASNPFNGPYGIVGSSGSYVLTDVTYVNCTGVNVTGATYTEDSGLLDTIAQRQFIMMKHTTQLAGQTTNALKLNQTNDSASLHQFRTYKSRVYATGWQSFTGSVSPCDITTTTVSLTNDDAVSEHTVIISVAGNPKAADVTRPDTTGLRAPAE